MQVCKLQDKVLSYIVQCVYKQEMYRADSFYENLLSTVYF